ncbi:hypothetical protein [Yersinia ruckeri]|uniref:hypothetical protein n=1 Tax=Yersinia ruckeri TaxID=29486 RepID=UPI0022379FAB|nr:hypothetical protein [Yersinia ruckeri]MCW6598731.1 hypothetical protein [Yersinia ruckeri]
MSETRPCAKLLTDNYCVAFIERNKKPDPNSKTSNPWFTRSFGKRGVIHASFKVSEEIRQQLDDPTVDGFYAVVRLVQELNYGTRSSVILMHPLKVLKSSDILQVKDSAIIAALESGHVNMRLKSKDLCQYWTLNPTARRNLLTQMERFSAYALCNDVVSAELGKDAELAMSVHQSDELISILDMADTCEAN